MLLTLQLIVILLKPGIEKQYLLFIIHIVYYYKAKLQYLEIKTSSHYQVYKKIFSYIKRKISVYYTYRS